VLQFILSITQLTIRKRQERDARSNSSIEEEEEEEGKRKPLHHAQKAVGPVMEVAERKLLRSRMCDIEGNECHGHKELLG
jgi:hypothetical protein